MNEETAMSFADMLFDAELSPDVFEAMVQAAIHSSVEDADAGLIPDLTDTLPAVPGSLDDLDDAGSHAPASGDATADHAEHERAGHEDPGHDHNHGEQTDHGPREDLDSGHHDWFFDNHDD